MATKPSEIINQERKDIVLDSDIYDEVDDESADEYAMIQGVYDDDYILVVGSGVILNREKYPDANGDMNTLLLNTINAEIGKKYRSLAEVRNYLPVRTVSPVYKILVSRQYNEDDICPELLQLIETYLFRCVFVTTPDSYVEFLMRRLWGDSLLVVNIHDDRSLKKFCAQLNNARDGKTKYSTPTLVYVFGKAVKGNINPTRFLESDEDAILYIEKWMKLDKEYPVIADFLKRKNVLGLGCKYEDWYFRFFWHILKRQFNYSESCNNKFGTRTQDNVVLSVFEPSLEKYLKGINVCVHTDPWKFMSRLHYILTSTEMESPYRDIIMGIKLARQIFISYKMDPDHGTAKKLFERLHGAGSFRLWFDQKRLLGGDMYNVEIKNAIESSSVFMPVLTSTVAGILKTYNIDNSNPPYFIQEWMMARRVPGIKIIPVAFEGYDLRGPEHRVFESIILDNIEEAPSGIFLGSVDNIVQPEFDKLVESLYSKLEIFHE